MLLHLINKSPFSSNSLDDCLRVASKNSPILFYEDGIYAAMKGTELENKIKTIMNDHPIYVLKEDLNARGIHNLVEGITEIDYNGFVDLVEKYNTFTWT